VDTSAFMVSTMMSMETFKVWTKIQMPTAETRAELRTMQELMLEALEKPILDYEKISAKDAIDHDDAN
jgi:hypothetical protein